MFMTSSTHVQYTLYTLCMSAADTVRSQQVIPAVPLMSYDACDVFFFFFFDGGQRDFAGQQQIFSQAHHLQECFSPAVARIQTIIHHKFECRGSCIRVTVVPQKKKS